MPKLLTTIPHLLGEEEAIRRLRDGFNNIKETCRDQVQDLQESWNGNTLTFRFSGFGFRIKGTVVAESREVKVAAVLPFAAMMFKGMIERQVQDHVSKLLA